MEPAISIKKLTKVYRLGAGQNGPYRTIRETIMEALTGSWSKIRTLRKNRLSQEQTGDPDEFRALDDVSLEVQAGEVVGIIGRNGAGKSTLLKILSRITEPTEGRITALGRVGSLLEVGTGFHPELTGRENIYLNGAILGMSRREITRKFDEVVAFAEIEKFLEMPVKRYSSGMYVRLAFAVASHLEPEILIVDEVLAVGDIAFQKKCLGKMGQVSSHGRTVLFVSHNMSAIKSLCGRAILLEKGRVVNDGCVDDVVNKYLNAESSCTRDGTIPQDADRIQDVHDEARIRSVGLTGLEGIEVSQLYYGQSFRVIFTCDIFKEIKDGHFEVSISTLDGVHVLYSRTVGDVDGLTRLSVGRHKISAHFDVVLLPRSYTIDLGVHHNDGTTADFVPHALNFTVLSVAEAGGDHYRWHRVRGMVRAQPAWHHETTA